MLRSTRNEEGLPAQAGVSHLGMRHIRSMIDGNQEVQTVTAKAETGDIPLTQLIEALRDQLGEAARGERQGPKFKVNSIEVELTIVAKRDRGGDGKIKFSVLTAGAEIGASGKVAHEETQKVKLSLTPVTATSKSNSSAADHLLIGRTDVATSTKKGR